MDNRTILVLKGICKCYYPASGPVNVLRGLDLEVEKGRSLSISGPSGSGKTTLLNLISALDSVDSGSILFEGRDIGALNASERVTFRMQNLGMVFQQHYLLPQCTALENILLPTLPVKMKPEKAREKAEHLLQKIGLQERRDHFPAELSGGECQRVALARALINDPKLVLADEPTGALDRDSAMGILELLHSIPKSGGTLITVTHADFVAREMMEHFTLSDGKLIN